MNISLNQHNITIAPETTLLDLLAQHEIKPEGIAVAMNNRIIPRAEWTATYIEEGANIVVIQATYGG